MNMIPGGRSMIWLNYRRSANPSLAVPAPFDDNSSQFWWWDRIGMMAERLAGHGFTDALLPQPCMTQSGAYRTGDGYGLRNHYSLGDDLNGGPTRFGKDHQARRAVAILRANGIACHTDLVVHQMSGGVGGRYRYPSSTGKENGRFPKDRNFFRGDTASGWAPQDPVIAPADDFAFGDEFSPVSSEPSHVLWDQLLAWADWLLNTLGVQGARIDDTKGEALAFLRSLVVHGRMRDSFLFAEHATGSSDDLAWFLAQMPRSMSVIDFGAHYEMIMPLTKNGDRRDWQASWIIGKGFIARDPMHAIPFVESMDSDTNGFATVVNNKALGYALMLAGEGLPMTYIRDYLREPGCYGLDTTINNLNWCRQMLASGPTVWRYSDANVLAFERTGKPGMICTLNQDIFNPNWHTIHIQTAFGPNRRLHDYTGHDDTDRWTDWQGGVTLGVPPGADGHGYGMWSLAGLGGAMQPTGQTWCQQVFYGADDLVIPPASGGIKLVGVVWCEKDTPFTARLRIDTDDATLSLLPPVVGKARPLPYARGSEVEIDARGWHSVWIARPAGAPALPYECTIRYRATRSLNEGDL